MTRTVVADAAMSACAHAASARPAPIPVWPVPGEPAVSRGSAVSREPACARGVPGRLAARSYRLGPARQPLPPQRAEMPRPPYPRQPVPVHPLYLYLPQWHVATIFGWSFDPGRDILCILILPLRWLQWP
jgi:hypothetical protein